MRSRPRALVDLRDGLWSQVEEAVERLAGEDRSLVARRLADRGYTTSERQARETLISITAGDDARVGLPMLIALSEVLRLPLPRLAEAA